MWWAKAPTAGSWSTWRASTRACAGRRGNAADRESDGGWIARASMQLRKQNGPPQGPVRDWMKAAAGSSSGRLGLVASGLAVVRSEEHTSELQSLMRISYAVFCLNTKMK